MQLVCKMAEEKPEELMFGEVEETRVSGRQIRHRVNICYSSNFAQFQKVPFIVTQSRSCETRVG